ncbi:MAG TPA: secretin N-terminal domain-containing protein [Candidatus Acidoferrales bacterium]|nr:secretin N-terminal domain-containing protein [Candidatus Acidoferrales bacterium]
MKKMIIAVLFGGLVLQQAALSQTNADGTSPAPATGSATTTPAAANADMANPAPAAADTNAPALSTATNAPAEATGESSAGAATNAAAAPVASIPLIQFQDVPLTTAIENLARQAGINYLLDPKIGFGQPDQNGQVKAEPTLSIRWENITAEQALRALLDNYGLQMVEDKTTHISRITAKDPSAPPPLVTRVIQLKYASVSNMTVAVQSVFTDKRSKVLPDSRTSQLIVVATDPEQSAVDTLISQLDTPTRQVLIEAKLVEISSNPETKKGIDWSGTLSGQNVTFGNNLNANATTIPPGLNPPAGPTQFITSNGIPGLSGLGAELGNLVNKPSVVADTASGFGTIGFLNADGVNAVISFLNSSAEAQVVSTPRIVTLDNETAQISVTRAFPVINITASTANTTAGSTIAYTNVGVVLTVTPRISANDYIWLKVIPDVSQFFNVQSQIIGGAAYQADIFDFRHIETQVMIPNANTLVMGGMVQDNPNTAYNKVPLLGDIPILGLAFRHEDKSVAKDNLLIFITPTIVKDTDFVPTTTGFLKSRPNTMKNPLKPNGLWESAAPYDWSNPKNTDPAEKVLNQESP